MHAISSFSAHSPVAQSSTACQRNRTCGLVAQRTTKRTRHRLGLYSQSVINQGLSWCRRALKLSTSLCT